MKCKRIAGACLMMALVLSGCGKSAAGQTETSMANSNAAVANNGSQQQDQGRQRPSFNPNQMQMMLTFRSLLTMDKTDGLAITKEEADTMLPLVQAAVAKGDLTADDITNLEESLTPEQKKFLEDAAVQAKDRGRNFSRNDSGNTTDSNLSPRPSRSPRPRPSNTDGVQNSNGQGRNGGFQGGFQGGFANIGQQLEDLLQSKAAAQ